MTLQYREIRFLTGFVHGVAAVAVAVAVVSYTLY